MPKKHAPSFTHTKSSYVHPSLEFLRSSMSSSDTHPAQTVNQRIEQLRREQAPRASPERRAELTELATQRTVPPALRRILNMAEVDAPPPNPGSRTQNRGPQSGIRPPPGPAIPSSWLQDRRHALGNLRKAGKVHAEGEGSRFGALAREHDAEYKRLPRNRSLVHHCLRTLALHWEELAEYEQNFLPALPIHHKEALLSYLSRYGAKGCMDFKSFRILFQNEKEVEGTSSSEDIRFIDLTGLLNKDYTLVDLNKSLNRSFPSTAIIRSTSEPSLGVPKHKAKAPIKVADSWEDEEASPSSSSSIPPSYLSIPIFPNLTRLSLAHPGPWASWTELLALSTKLNTLTHLSLAYWPHPSTTPNAYKHTKPISLGDSHFYSDLEDYWQEAANILRRLSLNTYCLKWLDLEGCTWHSALTLDFDDAHQFQTSRLGAGGTDEWIRSASSPGPDWATAWRQIQYLKLYQGWIPADRASLQAMPAGVVPIQLMRWLRENGGKDNVKAKLVFETEDMVRKWLKRERVARGVAGEVLRQRQKGNCAVWCAVDHGWEWGGLTKKELQEAAEVAEA